MSLGKLMPLGLAAMVALSWVAANPTQSPPRTDEIQRAIRELGDDQFRVRERASATLWKAGRQAESILQDAMKSPDAEVVRRARLILDRFRWGIYPDTPREVVDLIERYRGGDAAVRMQVLHELLRQGRPAHGILHKLATAEDDPIARENFWARVVEELPLALQPALLDEQFDLVEAMLEFAIASHDERVMRDYVTCLMLRGRAAARAAELQQAVANVERSDDARLLSYLYRAQGDLKNSVWAARKTGDEYLTDMLLRELGDWSALATETEAKVALRPPNVEEVELLGFRLAYHRLAKHEDRLAGCVADLRKLLQRPAEDPETPWFVAEALLCNGYVAEAIEVLKEGKDPARAMVLLATQMHYQEALRLADEAPEGTKRLEALIEKGRILHQLGYKQQAEQAFHEVAKAAPDQLEDPEDFQPILRLFERERKLGLHDLLFEHAGRLLPASDRGRNQTWVLNVIFEDKALAAESWWTVLARQAKGLSGSERLRRVHAILEGKVPYQELRQLADVAEKLMQRGAGEEREGWLITLADAFEACGKFEEAEQYLRRAAQLKSGTASLRLADFLYDRQWYEPAAEEYQRAWELDKQQIVPYYLRGLTLTRLGRVADGQKLMEQAHWLPLGKEDHRYALADVMTKRQRQEDANRERQLILRLGDFESVHAEESRRQLAIAAVRRKDYLASAADFERYLATCLRLETNLLEVDAYVSLGQLIPSLRARGYLAAGQVDESLREAREAIRIMPGNVDVVLDVHDGLTKQGRADEANKLYVQVKEALSTVLKEHKDCAMHLNNVAWLMACCRRDLDEALQHAQRAVDLEPKLATYLDTLAEVHFQKQQPEQAIALMKKCREIDPKRNYYQLQLKRFEAGDPLVPVPDAEFE